MTPQFVDLNADGYQDMVIATFEGTAFLVEGSKEGYKKPKHILDTNDEMVRISMYWDLEESDYLFVDRSSEGEEYIKDHHMTSIAVVDWDQDEDLDLVLGAYEGGLYLCLNEGTKSEPSFSDKNLLIHADGERIEIAGGLATPRICDWNKDGLFDILCGGAEGGVFYFQNLGEPGTPKFAKSKTLIERYKNKNSNEEDYLTSLLVPSKNGLPACPGKSMHIDVVDYDGDGDLDILAGAQSYCLNEDIKELTDAEKEELKQLKKLVDEANEKIESMLADKSEEEQKELFDSEEFQKLTSPLGATYQRLSELQPGPKEGNYVWIYRNKGTGSEATFTKSDPAENNSEEAAEEMAKPATENVTRKTATNTSDELQVTASFGSAKATPGENVDLEVTISIPEGYHIYGADSQTYPTAISILDAGSLEVSTSAEIPEGRVVVDAGKTSYWLENVVTLKQTFKVPSDFESTTIQGEINYMICNEDGCRPPSSEKFSATISK